MRSDSDLQIVTEYERALLTTAVRRSRLAVDRLLDPAYREIGASGRLWSRAAIISALADNPSDDETPIRAGEMEGSWVTDDLILLTYVTDHAGRRARRSSLWRRTDAEWRLLFHQGTLSAL